MKTKEQLFKELLAEAEKLLKKYNFYKKNDNYDDLSINKINYFVNQSKNKELVSEYKKIVEDFEMQLKIQKLISEYDDLTILNLCVEIRYFIQDAMSFLFKRKNEIENSIEKDKVSILLPKFIKEKLGADSFIIDFDDCFFCLMDDYADWKIKKKELLEEN